MSYDQVEFEALVKNVASGESVEADRLTHYLTLPEKEDRLAVNLALADAYHQRHQTGGDSPSLLYARACIDRAQVLSHYSAEIIPLLIKINQSLGDVEAIKQGLKNAGIEQERRGAFDDALLFFDRWAFADTTYTTHDSHKFDPDILASVGRMASLHRFEPHRRGKPEQGRKIRLAYLMQGLTEPGSVLVKIDKVFARLHDKSRFDVAYFIINDEREVLASPDAQAALESIRESGCHVVIPALKATTYERLLSVGSRMHDFDPDIMITSAGLGTLKNYFVSCLRPAPLIVSLHQGPSAQFTWHNFDHAISWFRALIPDCPTDCSYVPLEFELPRKESNQPAPRQELELEDAQTVIVSGGRWHKFQDASFWSAMAELLAERDDFVWVVIGVAAEKVPFLKNLTESVRQRIRLLGWRADYLRFLAAADVVVDTYPLGGGVFPIEAMSLGLPVVSFEHDYVRLFENSEGSGGQEIVAIPELLVRRGDFEQLKKKIVDLSDNKSERARLGEMCFQRMHREQGDPKRMVRRCEEIYARLLEHAGTGAHASENFSQRSAGESNPEAHRLALIEREEQLNRREATLGRREARLKYPTRVKQGLLRRWRRLTEK
jgi:glycosyltransferase involved in cell wall biosynthesis